MKRNLDQIEEEVLRLPEESRAKLMERLLLSFREEGGWLLLEANRLEDRLPLPSIGCELSRA